SGTDCMNPVQTDVLTPVRVNTIQTEKGRAEGRRQRGGAVEEEACQRVAGLMRSKWFQFLFLPLKSLNFDGFRVRAIGLYWCTDWLLV
ncbi:hypothetical protein BHE74_00040679, partial [Ensete ventricosum]